MFTHYRTQGFILKKTDQGETDRVFTVFTSDFGKLELLAKAVRKIKSKLRAGLEIFYLSEIEFIQGKAYKTLTDAILVDNFKNLRKSLGKLAVAYKISEVFDNLVRGQEADEKLWQLLNENFKILNNPRIPPAKYQVIYHYFLWNLLSILGYKPELYRCSSCQKKLTPENNFFNLKEGGLLCGQCKGKVKSGRPIELNVIKIIRIILKRDWTMLEKLKIENSDLKSLSTISSHYLSEVLRQTQ
ncbi:MAG: DNA repair protein RecO [Candidatus Pacebacteria bacterium]|nr:DNA repair protein RecO [Candidatus Paceibacterota bacterium]